MDTTEHTYRIFLKSCLGEVLKGPAGIEFKSCGIELDLPPAKDFTTSDYFSKTNNDVFSEYATFGDLNLLPKEVKNSPAIKLKLYEFKCRMAFSAKLPSVSNCMLEIKRLALWPKDLDVRHISEIMEYLRKNKWLFSVDIIDHGNGSATHRKSTILFWFDYSGFLFQCRTHGLYESSSTDSQVMSFSCSKGMAMDGSIDEQLHDKMVKLFGGLIKKRTWLQRRRFYVWFVWKKEYYFPEEKWS